VESVVVVAEKPYPEIFHLLWPSLMTKPLDLLGEVIPTRHLEVQQHSAVGVNRQGTANRHVSPLTNSRPCPDSKTRIPPADDQLDTGRVIHR